MTHFLPGSWPFPKAGLETRAFLPRPFCFRVAVKATSDLPSLAVCGLCWPERGCAPGSCTGPAPGHRLCAQPRFQASLLNHGSAQTEGQGSGRQTQRAVETLSPSPQPRPTHLFISTLRNVLIINWEHSIFLHSESHSVNPSYPPGGSGGNWVHSLRLVTAV